MRHSGALLLPLVAALVTVGACGGSTASESDEALAALPGSTASRAQTIRLEIPAEPDVSDVTRLMARDALRQAGYTVEATAFRDNVIAVQGLVTGHVDIAVISLPGALAAIQQGAGITVIMEAGGHTRGLVTAPDIRKCSDLHQKQVAVPNLVSAQTLAFRRYIATQCPGTEVETVIIAGADNRLAALLAQRTGGALLDLMALLEVQRQGRARFNLLSVFGTDFPGLAGAAVVASRSFLDRYPDTARDVVRAWVLAARAIQDPAVLAGEIENRLGLEPERAAAAATAYLAQNVWNVNGGLAEGFMQRNIDFAVEMGALKPGLAPADTADPRYLAAVLAEIGRK